MRAMVWVVAVGAAMGGGCGPETGDVFSDVSELHPKPELCALDADCHAGQTCAPDQSGTNVCCPVAVGGDGVCALLVHVECVETADCPRPECHSPPVCMDGKCMAEVAPMPNTCTGGICTSLGECVPCDSDAACMAGVARSIGNECYSFTCSQDGACVSEQKPVGDPCNFANGHCKDGAGCDSD